MADSPSHKFGQIIGNLLEELIKPEFLKFCKEETFTLIRKLNVLRPEQGKK